MKIQEIRRKAEALGVCAPGGKKSALIQAIQKKEGNKPCYGSFGDGCPYTDCCWRADCMKEK